jgi:NADH/NAD ratio-sensing transcriptional regulator Rex
VERISKNYSRAERGKWYVHTEFGVVPATVGSELEELYAADRAELERVVREKDMEITMLKREIESLAKQLEEEVNKLY